ncbi:MAG: universal stress protein [Alphaproteobacteria bacterium]|nr:MAG: universal stress protein [Alphaproteobacteria bacterium]
MKATLQQAASDLSTAGFAVSTQVIQGDPRLAIPEHVVLQRFDLLAMGSFRSSRLKSLILGSLTSDLVRACQVPILLC